MLTQKTRFPVLNSIHKSSFTHWRQTRSAREAFPHAATRCSFVSLNGTAPLAPLLRVSDPIGIITRLPNNASHTTAQTTSCTTQNPALLSRHKSSAKVRWLILLFNKVVICCHHRNRATNRQETEEKSIKRKKTEWEGERETNLRGLQCAPCTGSHKDAPESPRQT